MDERIDFFISRASQNAAVAIQINRILTDAGFRTIMQDKDFGHRNFLAAMDEVLQSEARVIALLSNDYLLGDYTMAEAYAALAGDILNKKQRLIPIRIDNCRPAGLLANIAYLDLTPILEGNTRLLNKIVLTSIKQGAWQHSTAITSHIKRTRKLLHPEIRPVHRFAGRDHDLLQLSALFRNKEESTIAAITGLAGIGKSVLSIEYSVKNAEHYQGIWLIRAENREGILNSLIELGEHNIPGLAQYEDEETSARTVLDWIANTEFAKPWLLIYDNVLNPEIIDGLTPCSSCHILITSRWEDWDNKLNLEPWSRKCSVAYLQSRAKSEDENGANKLAELLGDLPLAIEQAGSFCRSSMMSFEAYYEHSKKLLQKRTRSGSTYPDSVWVTFTQAFNQVVTETPSAKMAMALSSFWASDDIPLFLISEEIMSPIERADAIAALSDVSLITRGFLDGGIAAFSVHRLLQTIMREYLAGDTSETAISALKLVKSHFPAGNNPSDPTSWAECKRLAAHAIAVLSYVPDNQEASESAGYLANQLGLYYKSRGNLTFAVEFQQMSHKINEKYAEENNPNLVIGICNLSSTLRDLDRVEEAEHLARKALKISSNCQFLRALCNALSLNSLAESLRYANRLDQAEPYYRQAMSICQADPFHCEQLFGDISLNLASLLVSANRIDEAISTTHFARNFIRLISRNDPVRLAIADTRWAKLLLRAGLYSEAEQLYRDSLNTMERVLGSDHVMLADIFEDLANIMRKARQLEEAKSLEERKLEIVKMNYADNHPRLLDAKKALNPS